MNLFDNNSMREMKSTISRLATHGKPQEEFLFANINEFHNSEGRAMMLKAQDYYKNENDILERKRYYINRRGVKQEVTNLSNSKLPQPFMRKLTDQKVNYLLSKQLSIQCDDDKFAEVLNEYLGKRFLRTLKNVGKHAIINGIAWIQVYYDKTGKLSFKRIPSEEIIPF